MSGKDSLIAKQYSASVLDFSSGHRALKFNSEVSYSAVVTYLNESRLETLPICLIDLYKLINNYRTHRIW